MPKNQEIIVCPVNRWTLLTTDGPTSTLSFAVVVGKVYVKGTASIAYPSDSDEFGWPYDINTGELSITMAELFRTAGINRLWARPMGSTNAAVLVDYVED